MPAQEDLPESHEELVVQRVIEEASPLSRCTTDKLEECTSRSCTQLQSDRRLRSTLAAPAGLSRISSHAFATHATLTVAGFRASLVGAALLVIDGLLRALLRALLQLLLLASVPSLTQPVGQGLVHVRQHLTHDDVENRSY